MWVIILIIIILLLLRLEEEGLAQLLTYMEMFQITGKDVRPNWPIAFGPLK